MEDRRLSWKDVRDRLHAAILTGTYGAGDKLPRDIDIAQDFGCARSTVQRAMQDLSDTGIVERRRKGGTRVRRDPVVRATLEIPITRLEVEQRGGDYGYQLIRKSIATPPRAVQGALALPEARDLLHVEALHLSDGRPYIYEDRWVCTRTAPGILDLDLSRDSANEWLVKNKPYSRFDLRLYAEKADARTADILGTAPGEALLVIERTTWTDDAPITTVKSMTAPNYQLLTRS